MEHFQEAAVDARCPLSCALPAKVRASCWLQAFDFSFLNCCVLYYTVPDHMPPVAKYRIQDITLHAQLPVPNNSVYIGSLNISKPQDVLKLVLQPVHYSSC